MRLLVLNHNATDRGTYHRAFPFAREFARLGHDVVFCCVSPRRLYRADVRRDTFDGGGRLTIYEMPCWSGAQDSQEGRGPLDIFRRCLMALGRRYDAVWAFSHKPDCVIPARLVRWRSKALFLSDWCDRWGGEEGLFENTVNASDFRALPQKKQRARRRAFASESRWEEQTRSHWADGVTVISQALFDRCLDLGVPRGRLIRLYSGADTDAVTPLDRDTCRQQLGLNISGPLLGFMANYNPDPDLLYGALERIFNAVEDVRFVCCGQPPPGECLAAWPEPMRRRVHYLGRLPHAEMVAMLGAADLALLPLSDRALNRERFPHKLTDYLSAGRPVAACRVGEIIPLFERKSIGVLGSPTAEGLARACLDLLNRSEEWKSMGRSARRMAEEQFDWQTQAQRALDFIQVLQNLGLRTP